MSHIKFLSIILLSLAWITGCTPSEEQSLGALPTLVILPTLEPTATITPSLTLTVTHTPTHTPTATFTPTPQLTNTPRPSNTAARPSATFTATLTATPTSLPPTNTVVIVGSPTSDVPSITSFTASATTAAAGGSVLLQWQANGDIARIERLSQAGQVLQTFSVTPSGELPVTIPANEGSLITYRLTISRGTQQTSQTISITVGTGGGTVNCAIPWFFGNELAPANAGCPTTPSSQVTASYQPFQNGRMFLVQNTVYILIDPGLTNVEGNMTAVTNGWDNTSTYANYNTFFGCESPPSQGFFEPQQMFAWAYCTTLAPSGSWNQTLGWATSAILTGPRTIQYETTGALYIDTPTGNVYRLQPVPQGQLTSIWRKVK